LPFTDVRLLGELAVDDAGDVYVTGEQQVYELAPGADTPTPLPFTGLSEPSAVAVADDGSVVVTDGLDKRVLRLIQG
jgi:serine/threonine-protein kinase